MNFIYKFQKFMNDRYGLDELFKLLFIIYTILVIVSFFIHSHIIDITKILIVIITFYRYLSKKIKNRRKENEVYLKIKNKIISIFKKSKNTKSNDYVYKKCHSCHKKLRLPIPYKRGIKHSICPICKKKNTFIILKQQKIEIIK